jgi:hypothetical protein
MKIYVRGGLGMQVLELMVGLALSIERKDVSNVEEVCVSIAGDVVQPVKLNYLKSVCDVGIPCNATNTQLKQNAWTRQNFEILCKHYEEVISRFKFFEPRIWKQYDNYFHIRGKDRKLISAEKYIDILKTEWIEKKKNACILSDDKKFSRKIFDRFFSEHIDLMVNSEPVEDWFCLRNAKEVMGPFSTFTISAWLTNPEQHLTILGPEYNDKQYLDRKYYDLLELLFERIKGNGRIKSM